MFVPTHTFYFNSQSPCLGSALGYWSTFFSGSNDILIFRAFVVLFWAVFCYCFVLSFFVVVVLFFLLMPTGLAPIPAAASWGCRRCSSVLACWVTLTGRRDSQIWWGRGMLFLPLINEILNWTLFLVVLLSLLGFLLIKGRNELT